MKFKEWTDVTEKLKGQIQCGLLQLGGPAFVYMLPLQREKVLPLKNKFKPDENMPGMASRSVLQLAQNPQLSQIAINKISDNNIQGSRHTNDSASFKLHISLNDIAEMDEEVIIGLLKLLSDEANSPDNELVFYFKLILPSFLSGNERFQNTDQLTLYFDKYTSASAILKLADKIDSYMKEHKIPPNKNPLGFKDSFGFNSFVSARFDTNKLLNEYGVYMFFDLELEKFYKKHKASQLDSLPLCMFEAVFNHVITSSAKELQVLVELSPVQSELIQKEFEKALANPLQYLTNTEGFSSLETVEPDLTAHITDDSYAPISDSASEEKENLDDELLMDDESKRKNNMECIAHLLENQAHPHKRFLIALTEFGKKVGNLPTQGKKYQTAMHLFNDLYSEYDDFSKGKPYSQFKEQCDSKINAQKNTLGKHRGWKEVILNVLAAIASLGVVTGYQLVTNKRFFFKVETDSSQKADNILNAADDLDPNQKPSSLD